MTSEVPSVGQWLQFGYKVAKANLDGIRHTQMTRDNIAWSNERDKLLLLNWEHGVKSSLPDDFRQFRDDYALLISEVGPIEGAAFRAGYVYRMGPLAELIFHRLNQEHKGEIPAEVDEALSHMWDAPEGELDISDSLRLTPDDQQRIGVKGTQDRKAKNRLSAKRSFWRCGFAADEAGERRALGAALFNLSTVYGDEERLIRAYGAAALGAVLIDAEEDSEVWMRLAGTLNMLRAQLLPDSHKAIATLFESVVSPWNFMWRLDDLEIAYALGNHNL